MRIFETLARDPRTHALVNKGQARISDENRERAARELRAELETFVCDGQYGDAIERILSSYLGNLDRPRQDAAWVSGFYGSGKSHLLKMLGHLWVDTAFPDGATARTLVQGLPDQVQAHLRELDTTVARSKVPAVAAAAALPSKNVDSVKTTVLSIILHACGLPEQYAQAQFCFWLQLMGFYDRVRDAVEDSGKDWLQELGNLYVSATIADAVLACDPDFAADKQQARQTLRAQFPNLTRDITTDEFLKMARNALAIDGQLPHTVLILDEVQHYIGDSLDRAIAITELTEAICTQLDSKIMLVGAGQSALSASPRLQYLKDRYKINAQLADTDVEAVTRKVLLWKNPSKVDTIKTILDENAGEIAKHLDNTKLSVRADDATVIVEDYPLLPTRRRFWEECFRAVDAAGTHSQLRSQLRILHDTLRELAEEDVGNVIPADALFGAIAGDLVQTGVLLNEIYLRIRELDDGTEAGTLRKRICGLVFLISKLPREGAIDTGVRATARVIADLLVSDIREDSGPFRSQVEAELESLATDGTLMKVGGEYRLQTTEGAEWERAYREKVGAIRNQDADIAVKRDQLLGTSVQQAVGTVKLIHGDCKEKRVLQLHSGPGEPNEAGEHVSVWLRDGWSVAQTEVESTARKMGAESPTIHVFLPRKAADDLKSRIVEVEAAQAVIDIKGVPSTNEGREAREAMQSRVAAGTHVRDELVRDITIAARVFQGGGAEVFGDNLETKLREAANASLSRLYPEFNDGDHKSWGTALKRAKDGSDEPLRIVGWEKSTEEHPVVRRVVTEIGNGAQGAAIRKTLQSSPYGWPRDAIDAALVALHRQGAIRARGSNRLPISPGDLDQNKISAAEFAPEKVRMSASDKLQLRSLFQAAGLSAKAGEEELKATEFLSTLSQLAAAAGGEAPLPNRPSTTMIEDLGKLDGNERLSKILENKDSLESNITAWEKMRTRAAKRVPAWQRLEKLSNHAASLPIYSEVSTEIEAIRANRSLLDDTDAVTPLTAKTANALRGALTEQFNDLKTAYDAGTATLTADASWQKLTEADRQTIRSQMGLAVPAAPVMADDEELLRELERSSLDARAAAAAAVSERVARALEEAARKLKPEAKRITFSAATLEDETAVKKWLDEQSARLLDAVKKGPVIVG